MAQGLHPSRQLAGAVTTDNGFWLDRLSAEGAEREILERAVHSISEQARNIESTSDAGCCAIPVPIGSWHVSGKVSRLNSPTGLKKRYLGIGHS
jgi:hypothetical protein